MRTETAAFLKSGPFRNFMGGRWVEALGGGTLVTRDPGSGKELAVVASSEAEDVDAAVRLAREAFEKSGWATMPSNDRAVILHRLADLVDRDVDILSEIESLDVGKPFSQARAFDIPNVAQTLRYYADLSVHTRRAEPIAVSGYDARTVRIPYGVCAFVIPWNFPLLLVGWGLAPALAAGNTVVLKPAEDTPLSALYFCRLAEEAGVPAGVINVVTGYGEKAGSALSCHPGINRMSFTGSPEVGRMIASACGANLIPVKLELGGKGAAVVFEDVEARQVAKALVGAVTLNAGQVCCTATRWMIHEKIWDEFIATAIEEMKSLTIGHGSETATQLGPVVSSKQKARVLGYLDKGQSQGAQVLLPGGEAKVRHYDEGYYVKPALLSGSPDNLCAREEIFGPVAYALRFRTEEEAVNLVNLSRYGLANSVWTQNLKRADRVAEKMVAGNSWVNAHNIFAHGIPYAGCNLSGCGGGVLGPETLTDYLRPQSIVRPL